MRSGGVEYAGSNPYTPPVGAGKATAPVISMCSPRIHLHGKPEQEPPFALLATFGLLCHFRLILQWGWRSEEIRDLFT